MESSIAPHLRRDRAYPTRKGPTFTPPYPAFSARFPMATERVVMAYFGVQYPDGGSAPAAATDALTGLKADLSGEDGAGRVDLAEYVDEAGYRTRIVIAYWDETDVFDRWAAAHPWAERGRSGQGVGFFSEIVRPTTERFETLFANDRLEGISALADGLSGEVHEHGYWGGARDRMPAGQDDALAPVDGPTLEVDGPVRTVRSGENPCLIRSGQEWTETADAERSLYLDDVEPPLRAGMEFLRDEGLAVGCYVNRYMTVLDDDWQPMDKTFGLSWWHSMEELDTWAEAHPTHLEIFRAALKYLGTMGAEAKLRLYHEVTVPPRQDAVFTYVDCHDRTGMLRAVVA